MRFTLKRSLALTALAVATVSALAGCAPISAGQRMHGPGGGPDGTMNSRMAMDDHMKSLQEQHDKMMRATSAEERNALMAEHQKAMQDFRSKMADMDCMGGPAGKGMGGMGMGMGGRARMMDGAASAPARP